MKAEESNIVEFKREYTDDIKKCVVAFANTSGGTIYVGINDDGGITGIKDIDSTLLKISNTIRDSIKPDITLFVKYDTEIIDDKSVIKVIVQKGTASPYYLANKGIRPEGVYLRQGASSVPATETSILKMIKDTDGEKYENIRSLNQDLTFKEAKKEFVERKLSLGINQQKSLKLMNTDGIYTNLALLLSDQCKHTIKLAVFTGTEKAVFKDRREFSGSLLKQLNTAYEYIDRYNNNRSEIEGLHRIDKRDYPLEAIREALINALIHRDYSFSGSTLISIFDDRIEFTSIGGLAKGISYDDILLGISITRNENLANIFYRLTLIEAYGTGMPKIIRSYNSYSCKPKIEVSDNAFKITLPNTNLDLHPAEKKLLLSENEQTVKEMFSSHESIVRKDIEKELSISQAMAVRILKGLVNKAVIKPVGAGKRTRYVIIK
jgi:ATP-dependent DNA helicase RecG